MFSDETLQLTNLKERIAADPYDVKAWEHLAGALEKLGLNELRSEQCAIYEDLLAQFPTAVRPPFENYHMPSTTAFSPRSTVWTHPKSALLLARTTSVQA